MFSLTKKTLLALAGVAAFAAGGATLAGAATKSTSSSSASPSSRAPRAPQTPLTGDTADKVKAAAEAKVPGGTVRRVEGGGPEGSAYHAHVRKSDGSEVVVLVNSNFEATAVQTRPARGRDGRDHGRGGPGGPGGRGGHGREAALTGDTAAKVKAAAEAKVPGGTVLRVEGGGPEGSAYHAHVRKSDGSEVVVLVNASFDATSVVEHPHP